MTTHRQTDGETNREGKIEKEKESEERKRTKDR